jgi:DNA polymerase-3 subunit gamma/tau
VTVLSRCLQFNLRPMAPETVLDHLTHVLAAEGVAAEPAALRLLARGARGSMRDALSLTDQAIAFGSGQLQEASVRQMLGSVDRTVVFSLIDALVGGDGKAVVTLSDQLRAAGQSAANTLEDMASVLQRMAVHQAVPDMAVDDTDPDAQETARLAARLPADETQLLYSLCIHGRAELGLAPDEYTGLTMVLLRLLPFRQAPAAHAQAISATAEKKSLKTPEAPPAVAAQATALRPAAPLPPAAAPETDAAAPQAGDPDTGGFAPVDARPVSEADLDSDWDEPAPPAPASRPRAAALQPLPVRQMPGPVLEESKHGLTPDQSAQTAPEVIAISVRESSDEPAPARPVQADAPPPPVVTGAEGDFWHALVQELVAREAVTALVRELALQSQLVARSAGQWTLRVESESLAQSGGARERLQAALADAGHAVRLQIDTGPVSDSPARRNAIHASRRLKAAEALLMADPFVQEMMRDFGAKIVPGSIKPL